MNNKNNKRGVALIFGLLVVLVLVVLLGAFFLKTMNENMLVKRYVNSMQAFWTAEAGVAEALRRLPNSPINGILDSRRSFETITTYRTTINQCKYYDISSTGIVTLSTGGDVRRTLTPVVKTGPVDPTKFQYGIHAANDLCFGGKGSCNKNPNEFLDPTTCNDHPCWKEFDSAINFADMFGYEQDAVKEKATIYNEDNFPGDVSGISWVDVTPGDALQVGGNEQGSGILIVNGNVHFTGGYQFRGIIWVLGNFTVPGAGNFDAYGSVVVASSAGVDYINGHPVFHWNQTDIGDALQWLDNINKNIVSWTEVP
jgi:uncharacterized protein (UPF0333 family)